MEHGLLKIYEALKDIANSLSSKDLEWFTAVIAFVTLIIVAFYTYYTKQIAKATVGTMVENLRPIVSCEIKSGNQYYSTDLIRKQPQLVNDTRCILTNHSKYNVLVLVNLNLELDGKSVEFDDTYAGKRGWPLTSFQGINGHFDLTKKFDLANIEVISIELEVSYKSDAGILYKNPTQYWYFDKESKYWVNNIGVRA